MHKLGIEHTRAKMVGRGVLLDVARHKGMDWLPDGYGISNAELDETAAAQGVEIRRGDFVIVRTGQMERCRAEGEWGGYAGGDAPGVRFENCYWCQEKQVAAICSDTWGVEVRPNETPEAQQPWHWVVIPAMGLTMGEMFELKELAADCAQDRVYEFFFSGPPLVITGGHGVADQSAGDQVDAPSRPGRARLVGADDGPHPRRQRGDRARRRASTRRRTRRRPGCRCCRASRRRWRMSGCRR